MLRTHATRLREPAAEEAVVLIPQSQLLSPRDLASEATRRAVRTMAYDLRTPVRAVGEYNAGEHLGRPRLIVLPSARVLSGQAWTALLSAVEQGATLLITGPLELDEYRRPTDRMSALGLPSAVRPVSPEEALTIDGRALRAGFRGEKLERVETAGVTGDAAPLVLSRGSGKIVWVPVPVELAEAPDATAAAYRFAARLAGLEASATVDPDEPSILVSVRTFADALLVVVANESSRDRKLLVTPTATGVTLDLDVRAGRAVLAVVDRWTGRLLDQTSAER